MLCMQQNKRYLPAIMAPFYPGLAPIAQTSHLVQSGSVTVAHVAQSLSDTPNPQQAMVGYVLRALGHIGSSSENQRELQFSCEINSQDISTERYWQ